MTTACLVGGCDQPRRVRGWCNPHYQRWAKHGDPLGGAASHEHHTHFAHTWAATEGEEMIESTTATLIDADGVEVSLNGRPLIDPVRAGYPSDIVQIRVDGSEGASYMAWISARELIAAIEKVASLGPEPDHTPAASPEPLWTEVRERPARAVEITPELVRRLAGEGVPPELAGLEPQFDRATGEPVGVIVFDRPGLATIGRYVVLSGAHGTSVLQPEDFERLFEVAT